MSDTTEAGSSSGIFSSEPVTLLEALRLAAAAGISFGLPLDTAQSYAVFAIMSVVLSAVARSKVFSPATVAGLVARYRAALEQPSNVNVVPPRDNAGGN